MTGFRSSARRIGTALAAALIFLCQPLAAASFRTASGGLIRTLDPVQADDLASRDLTALVYDTLLQYDYLARPYKLRPSMLKAMPEVSADFRRYEFELRDDLRFSADPVFAVEAERRVTVEDVFFSFLRFADARNHSPVYWMFRGKIKGLEAFRQATQQAKPGDFTPYALPVAGLQKISDRKFAIELTQPDPRFLYMLAMPNAAVVSRRAVRHYGKKIARHPVGSGPFLLKKWINNLQLDFVRNPDYRLEYFPGAETPADRRKPLPLLDAIEIKQPRQPITSWLLFLQGELDFNVLNKDNLDQLTTGGEVIPALKRRGVRLVRSPEFEIRYVGFNFADPLLGKNLKLRQALSLAYDIPRRVRHASGELIPAAGPIPPGVAGYDPQFRNPYAQYDLEKAKKLLSEAGYPGGIDPRTKKPLQLTFDQSGSETAHRQMGELAVDDWRKLGIEIVSTLNSKPRFYDKLRRKKFQLFRLSWVGDYPDAENFLQLFYSGNSGGCNRTGFSDPEFDRLFEEAAKLPDSPARTELYKRMVRRLASQCAWIYEGFPVTSELHHCWLRNFVPHDFSFVRWKYLNVDEEMRGRMRKKFRPLSFGELSGRQ